MDVLEPPVIFNWEEKLNSQSSVGVLLASCTSRPL